MIGIDLRSALRLDAARRLVAVDDGQLDVHQDQVGLLLLRQLDALLAVDGLDQLVAGAGQQVAQDGAVVLLVLDDEDALAHAAPRALLGPDRKLEAGRSSPCPAPIPPRSARRAARRCAWRWPARARCRPSSWCWSCRPAGTPRRSAPAPRPGCPGPVSATATENIPLATLAAMRTSPASVNLMALPTRLSSTWAMRRSSPLPSGSSSGTSTLSGSFLADASDSVADTRSARRPSSSTPRG